MPTVTFDSNGVGARATDNINLTVPSSTSTNAIGQYSLYNETDSTININFTVQVGHGLSTNDQAGNEIFIREGANQLIMAPLSGAVITLTRGATSGSATTGGIITATLCRTAHGSVSAEGERLIIEAVTA